MSDKKEDKENKQKLIEEYLKTKDKAVVDKILVAYTPLVEYIARRLTFQNEDIPDLVQVGSIGILKSLDNFLPEKNVSFSTFASANVIGEMRHYMRDKGRIVKIPRKIHDNYSKISTYIRNYIQENDGKYPTVKQIAEHIDMPEDFVVESLEAIESTKIVSLDKPMYDSQQSGSENHTLKDSLGVELELDAALEAEIIKKAIDSLSERKKIIIKLRFYEGKTQNQIATSLKCSQMHVSRLINDALKELKKVLKESIQIEE